MPRLYGERIVLREYKKEDLEHIRKWVNDPETTKNLSGIFLYPHTMNITENFYIDGTYTDTIYMGILKSEYQEIKENNELL